MKKSDHSLGERIREVRQTHGLTQKAFAESLGIAQGFLSSIERGRKIPSDTLVIAMTHLYRIDERWLSSGEGEAGPQATAVEVISQAPAEGKTPLLRRISAGFPDRLDPQDIVGHVVLPGHSPDEYALVAYGDFMAPTIQDNDLVFFKPQGEVKTGDIILVTSKWGEVILRRYRITGDGEWFSPDNSAYTPFQADPHSHIIGVVSNVWRKVKL